MAREILTHKVGGMNERLRVWASDDLGHGGAGYVYTMDDCVPGGLGSVIQFQNGPVAEVGINGVTNEVLIAVVIDRLQCFQNGQYACRENALALTKLEEAMHWLHHRTNERLRRGVEGTHSK